MALTIHAPHLPHLEDWAKHRTMLVGIAAVAITAGTVYVVQQQTTDSTPTLSAPAATGSLELRAGPSRAGSEAFGSAPAAATASVEFRSGHLLPGTDPLDGAPTAAVASAPAAAGAVEFRSGHLLPGTGASESAPVASSVARVSVHGR